MNFEKKYKKDSSTSDRPSRLVADILDQFPNSLETLLARCNFETLEELRAAYQWCWFAVATDKYLTNKMTQMTNIAAKLLLQRANKVCTAPNMERNIQAAAEGLWLTTFERNALIERRKAVFSSERSQDVYLLAKNKIIEIYGFSAADLERIRYFVQQARRDESDPALNRALYIWSEEKMTGKTTVAKIMAGILNGWGSWQDIQRFAGGYMSDIPQELQFNTFDRPKATRFACIVMDEAFAGKTTAKYYGKFKTALTSDTAAVQVKFGGTYDIKCSRNYIFTSNNDAASVVNDETERRIMVVKMNKPKQLPYETIFTLWKDFIINAPDETDVVGWYNETAQQVKGEKGIQRDDIASAFLSEDFRERITNRQAAGQYQVSFPHFFTQYITQVFDVKSNINIVKEAVTDVFGEPRSSGNRKYYNLSQLLILINAAISNESTETININQDYTNNYNNLPF